MKATSRTASLAAVFAVASQHRCQCRAFVATPRSANGISAPFAAPRSAWFERSAVDVPTRRDGSLGVLSMVSATFGEKVNTDKIVEDKTAREVLAEQYPEALAKNPGFLEEVGHGETRTFTEDELRRRLEVAHVFVNLANLVILSRGVDILADDFRYYSPGTGSLDRDGFLRLTKTLDVAFSTFRVHPYDFVVYKDGTVSYRRTFRAVHDGFLRVGEKTYPPTNTKVISDVDLCTVSFDDEGIIKSYAYGLMVELVYAIEDPDAVAEIEAIKKRIVNQEAKMKSLEGQESSIAYSKCKADIDVMRMDMETLSDRVNSAPNTGGLGGIPGLFAAVGAEFPSDLTNLQGTGAYGDIEGGHLASFSFPVEVKDYQAFDAEAFTEMTGRGSGDDVPGSAD